MKTKRLLALLLAVAMMFTMLVPTALADDDGNDGDLDPDKYYRFEFYASDTDAEPQDIQIIKDGQSLAQPGTPKALAGEKFEEWYIEGTDNTEIVVSFDKTMNGIKSLDVDGDGIIEVYPRFSDVVYVTFYDANTFNDGKPTGNIVTIHSMPKNGSIDLSSVTAESGELGKVFDKWVDGHGDVVETLDNVTVNTDLYATFAQGYSLVFDANGGASNTATQYLKITETPQKPSDPQRPGYIFDGWYTEATGGTQFTFDKVLTENTVVYAHWIADTAKYTVIYWYENADDNGYSYAGATTGTIATGSTITSSSFQNTNFTGRDSTHFTYNSAKAESQVVAGDGSTVLNVYFTRNTYTLTFKSGTGNRASTYQVITAKYQAAIGDQWPMAGQKYGNYTTVPSNLYYWSFTSVTTNSSVMQATKIHTMTADVCNSNGLTLIANTSNNVSSYTINYMMESLDGTGTEHEGIYYQNDSRYTQTLNYSTNQSTWSYKTIDGFIATATGGAPVTNGVANLYYKRNRNTITFSDGYGAEVASISDVMFEMPLSEVTYDSKAIKDIVPNCPTALDSNYYTFGGWYTTPDCYDGTEADFTGTMPNAPLSFYAKWTPATFTVTYHANGGSFKETTNKTVSLTISYGKTLSDPPELSGRTGYEFLGWVDGKDNAWNFATAITENVDLYAQWHTNGMLQVEYITNNGSDITLPTDDNKYCDGAIAIAEHYGDKHFVGWQIGNEETLYLPGSEIKVNSANDTADGSSNQIVTLCAVYADAFYVYHTNGTEETVSMKNVNADGTYNIITRVGLADGGSYLYGGYYKQEGVTFESEEDDGSPIVEWTATKTVVTETDEDGNVLSSETTLDENCVYTASGLTMEPKANTTYFLKEVSTDYLQPRNYYMFDTIANNVIKQMYLVTAVDDPNYKQVGFNLVEYGTDEDGKETTREVNRVCREVEVRQEGKPTVTLNLKNFFAAFGLEDGDGFLGIMRYDEGVGANKHYTFTPYFITPDSVKVNHIAATRGVFSNDGTVDNMVVTSDLQEQEDEPKWYNAFYEESKSSGGSESSGGIDGNMLSLYSTYAISDDESGVIDPEEPEVTEVTITTVVDGVPTPQSYEKGVVNIGYEEQPGEVFVGWFTEDGEAADLSDVQEDLTIYAKYIPAKSVRLNVTTSKGRGGIINVTASLNLPGAEVAEVGFRTDNGDELADVYKGSSYRAVWTTSASSSTVTVTPYWVTLDGTMVYGEPGTYRIRTNNSSLWGF